MKKKLFILPFVGAFLYISLSSYYYGPAVGGINGTGATGSTGGCNCHAPAPTPSTNVTIQLLSGTTPVTSYVPGNTYTLKITGTNTGSTSLPYFGFQACIVKASGAGSGAAVNAGTFGSAPAGTHVQSGTVSVFEHYNASFGDGAIVATTGTGGSGTTYVESISWQAPVAGTGSVVLYGVVNAVNHNLAADGGDLWNTASPVTICEQASPITGTLVVCPGATTSLSDVTAGGTWGSSNTSVATINSSTGLVTGVGTGTTTINYTTSCGAVTAIVTVNTLPSSISGPTGVCAGLTTSLFDPTGGGTWSSITPSVATIGTGGVVTGVSATGGTTLISYTIPATGCAATTTVTVFPSPSAIGGSTALCQGATTTLTNTLTGGTWTSGTTSVATIGTSGLLTAIVSGSTTPLTSVITYSTTAGCSTTTVVTVNPLPVPISGASSVCPGNTITLTETGGGSWSSSTPATATIGSSSGTVTGVATTGGTAIITYSLPVTGCSTTKAVTVNPAPAAISGIAEVCPGATITLTDGGGGSWTSANVGIATIGSSSGVVTGVVTGGGTTLITYTLPVTNCATTVAVTVDPAPSAISGTPTVCVGATTTLTDAGGGTWTSSSPGTGSIDPFGVVTGIAAGTTNITYALPGTGCSTTELVTVNPLPLLVPNTGTPSVCTGFTTTLNNGTPGGTWTSNNTAVATVGTSGIVTGVSSGVATITYNVTNTFGCSAFVTTVVTVNGAPSAITGTNHVCAGSVITLSETSSGNWSSNLPGIAGITTPGTAATLTGISAGTATITYTTPGTGCFTTTTITVNTAPGTISGASSVCIGSAITLTDLPAGGTWTSSNGNASVGTAGVVTGVTSGTSTISYTLPGSCTATKIVTVNLLPGVISGPSQVCPGATITLTDGGVGSWTSSSGNATVSGAGVVTGVTEGNAVITFTQGTGCYRTAPITINALPQNITGAPTVCAGQTTTLSDATGSGNWLSSNTAVATIGSGSGVVSATNPGAVVMTYSVSATGCSVNFPMTVNPLSPISGLSSLCSGSGTSLTDATSGGTWTSSVLGTATIGSSSGLVTAVAPGTSVIAYTTSLGCVATSTINVISAPSAISGPGTVCLGATITLTDGGGGTWSSSNPGVATVGSTSGIVAPVTTGTTTITYSLGTACTVSATVTVLAAPASISGPSVVCTGATIGLTDGVGGTWSSSAPTATVGTTGVVTGIVAGTAVITYTAGSGCYATKNITVNPVPAPISGTFTVCAGAVTTLTDDSTGGAWSSISGLVSVGTSSGAVTGLTPGVATIKYALPTGCFTSSPVTVNAAPVAISGPSSVCAGASINLTETGAGTWNSSNANATVTTTGNVTGVSSGTSVISFTNGAGCSATRTVTINATPAAIGGIFTVCAGSATTLTEASTGGTWSSVTTSVATVAGTSGVVTGISNGVSTISYTFPVTGCAQTCTVTVNPLPGSITGAAALCMGSTSILTDGGAGTWSSSLTAVATIGSSTGVIVPVAPGVTVVTYTLPTGCSRTLPVTINALPSSISGTDSVCTGATVSLTDAGSGSWLSGTPSVAAVGSSSGIVTGITGGIAVITYTLPTGCIATAAVTVHVSPSSIAGPAALCAGSTVSLTDGTSGGAWSSSAPGVATIGSTGVLTGILAGTTHISYTIGSGCAATVLVTVNPLPLSISGSLSVCALANDTLSDAGGGTWSGSTIAVATVGSLSGIVTGVSAGTDTITYTLSTGCQTSVVITVNPLPVAGAITGPASVCADSSVTLTDVVTGGTWSSVFTSIATIGTSGIVSGVTAGADTIKYAVTNGCGTSIATSTITVNPLPVAGVVSGPSAICPGTSATLTDTALGGTWSSSNTAVATIGATTGSIVTVAPGATTFTYSVTNGCGTAVASKADTVLSAPSVTAIVGSDSVCVGDTLHLSDLTGTGVWSVSGANATIDGSGVVTGVAAGTDTVHYTVTNTCGHIAATLLLNVKSVADCNSRVHSVPGMAASVQVYPNPSAGLFNVDLPASAGGAEITIADISGKVTLTKYIAGSQQQKVVLDLSGQPAGTYIIRINLGEQVFHEKLVIW